MDTQTPSSKNTTAFYAQSAIAFGCALFAMLAAIYFLPGDGWPKAFLALATLFLTTSSFSLAKCVRDAQESQNVVWYENRLTKRTATTHSRSQKR